MEASPDKAFGIQPGSTGELRLVPMVDGVVSGTEFRRDKG